MLAILGVPAEIAVHTTGHDLTDMSALWEYLSAKIAFTIPGAVVLSGWKALPRGQLGPGPRAPSFQPIIEGGVSVLSFSISTSTSSLASTYELAPAVLRQGGELRPMMRIATATIIMYYHERQTAEEMHDVLLAMRRAFNVCAISGDDPDLMLKKWGKDIRLKWDTDNLHLTGQLGHNGSEQIIHNVKNLGGGISRAVSGIAALKAEFAACMAELVAIKAALDRGGPALVEGELVVLLGYFWVPIS